MKNYYFDINDIGFPEFIKHKDKKVFICTVRQKPIQPKPEEILRQQIVKYLTEKLGYPSDNIDIEVPMTYFKPRKKGRADIIIYDRKFSNKDAKPFILIECKSPDNQKTINDYRIYDQIEAYDKIVNAQITMITNGIDFVITEKDTAKRLERLPTFSEIKANKKYQFVETEKWNWKRTAPNDRANKKLQVGFIKQNFISEYTDRALFPHIIQLMDLFYDEKTLFLPQKLGEIELIKDCGLRPANYGYAFSAGLIGNYRFFLIKQKDGNHRIVSYSIYHQNDWGTYLMIAVDDRQGHSIELRLDKSIEPNLFNKTYQIWHNGSLTVGKKGRLPNQIVVDYLKKQAPFLIVENKIFLGTFDIGKDLNFELSEVKDFILRTSTYAILREQIRQEKQ